MQFTLIDEIIDLYIKKEKQYIKQASNAILQSDDVVDSICLIFDTVGKRVSDISLYYLGSFYFGSK